MAGVTGKGRSFALMRQKYSRHCRLTLVHLPVFTLCKLPAMCGTKLQSVLWFSRPCSIDSSWNQAAAHSSSASPENLTQNCSRTQQKQGENLAYPFPVAAWQVPTNWVAKTGETYFLTVLVARSPKSSCRQGHAPSEGSRAGSFLAS